jgi:hypothetical protein
MAESSKGAGESSKEPFVSQQDRPEVTLKPDTPLSELRVRDLQAILGSAAAAAKSPHFEVGKTPLKDFFDKPFPEVAKDWIKELKIEKIEKPEKPEKLEKIEKYEKHEKEHPKFEKIEKWEVVFDPQRQPGPDPRIDQLVRVVTGLTEQLGQLANQVEELRKRK